MLKKILFAILTLSIASTVAFAGTTGKIAGKVVDKGSNEALPGANILIEGTSLGAAASVDGSFHIINVPPGHYTIVASMIGYQKIRITNVRVSVDMTTEVNFELPQRALAGEEVTIVAERPLIQKDMTASQSTMESAEIDHTAVNGYESVMVGMPGFVVAGGSEGGTVSDAEGGGIHVRGGRGGTLGFMVDGFYVEDALYGGIGTDVTREGIQELSVVTGTFNAEYGEALSGVVNIITKEGGADYEGRLRMATDELQIGELGDIKENNWHTSRLEASLSGPLPGLGNKLKFFLSGDRNFTNTYLNVTKHTLAEDAPHFLIPDSISALYVNDNDIVQLPNPDDPSLHLQPQTKGSTHWHNNNTFNNQWRGTGKITFAPSSTKKLIIGVNGQDQLLKNYSNRFKPSPEQNNRTKIRNLMWNATWNHTLSASTFYTLKAGLFTIWSHQGRFKDLNSIVPDLTAGPFSDFAFAVFGGQSNYEFAGPFPDPNGAVFVTSTGDTLIAPAYGEENYDEAYRSKTMTFDFDVTSQLSKHHQLKAGVEFKQLDIRHNILAGIKTSNDTTSYRFKPIQLAAYIQDKIELSDLIINVGLRWDYLDPRSPFVASTNDLTETGTIDDGKKKIHLSPRIGFGYPITDKAVLHFAYGMFTQNPDYRFFYRGVYTGSPLYPYPDIAEHFRIGNANLKPERTTAYEIGTEMLLTDEISMDVTLFYKDIYNYVSTKYFPFAQPQDYFTYVNEDYANSRGIEISVEKRFSNHFSARVNYTYSRAEGNAQSEETHFNEYVNESVLQEVPPKKVITLAWDQPHTLNFVLDVRQPRNWGINFFGRFGSGLPYSPTDSRGRLTDERNSARLPFTGTVDIRAEKYFSYLGFNQRIFLDVTNIFDKNNVLNVFGNSGAPDFSLNPNASQELIDRPHWFGAPRHFELGILLGF